MANPAQVLRCEDMGDSALKHNSVKLRSVKLNVNSSSNSALRIWPPDRPRDTAEKLGNVQAERDWSEKSSGSPEMPGWSATARLVKVRFGRTSWSELVSRTQCPRLEETQHAAR
jgi:hypothetical protein